MEKYTSQSVTDTENIAFDFAKRLNPDDTVLYTGEMGAGKTYFTKGIARALGVTEEVTSPTFALINEYYGALNIFHFDLYRISSFDDLYAIGFFDYFGRNGVLCIEWSENISFDMDYPASVYRVSISKTGDTSREITIEKVK